MTHSFLYHEALSLDDAARALDQPDDVSFGGGMDLLVSITEPIDRAVLLVGLGQDPLIRRKFRPLADGARRDAEPPFKNTHEADVAAALLRRIGALA